MNGKRRNQNALFAEMSQDVKAHYRLLTYMVMSNVFCAIVLWTIVVKVTIKMSDNVIQFPYKKMKRTVEPVPTVCELAANQFEQIIILGTIKKDKMVQMITTMKDPAEVLWHLESARFGIMHGLEEEENDE